MKRFIITLAVVLMALPTINAQSKDVLKALKELNKAKEAVSKKNDASSWIKLGTAYLYAFEAPVNGLATGMDPMSLAVLTKGQIKLGSEQKEINGKQFIVDRYSDKELYLNQQTGALSAYKILKPTTEEDELAKSLEAFEKAKTFANVSNKELIPIMQSLARRHWTNAICSYNLGEYKTASESFMKCFEITKSEPLNEIDTNALIYSGIAAVLGQNTERAINIFEQCRTLNVADGDIYANLADSYKITGDTAKCKAILAEGFEKFPTNQGILVSLINVYLDTNDDPQKIIAVIHKAQENEPTNASLIYAEGNLHRNMKEFDKAIELYRKAASVDPKYVYAPFQEGDTYYSMALDLQEQASAEPDDNKYMELNNKLNDCLKKAIEPFERAFSITDDVEIKKGCAEYLKQIFFRFRDEDPKYLENYNKYKAFVEEVTASAE